MGRNQKIKARLLLLWEHFAAVPLSPQLSLTAEMARNDTAKHKRREEDVLYKNQASKKTTSRLAFQSETFFHVFQG